jgi:hypothetical protein
MNIIYLCNLWKPSKILLTFKKRIKDEKITNKNKHGLIKSNGLYVFKTHLVIFVSYANMIH